MTCLSSLIQLNNCLFFSHPSLNLPFFSNATHDLPSSLIKLINCLFFSHPIPNLPVFSHPTHNCLASLITNPASFFSDPTYSLPFVSHPTHLLPFFSFLSSKLITVLLLSSKSQNLSFFSDPSPTPNLPFFSHPPPVDCLCLNLIGGLPLATETHEPVKLESFFLKFKWWVNKAFYRLVQFKFFRHG